jgi:AhpD family alkylhydroperoxidase
MAGLETYIRNSGLEPGLVELVKLRASQINGSAYCIDMHSKDARGRDGAAFVWADGLERAALALTEAPTLISETHAPDNVYEQARPHFSELEMVNLTMAIMAINGWNPLAPGIQNLSPGTYEPKARLERQAVAGDGSKPVADRPN